MFSTGIHPFGPGTVIIPRINKLREGVLACVHCYPRNTEFHNRVIKVEKFLYLLSNKNSFNRIIDPLIHLWSHPLCHIILCGLCLTPWHFNFVKPIFFYKFLHECAKTKLYSMIHPDLIEKVMIYKDEVLYW